MLSVHSARQDVAPRRRRCALLLVVMLLVAWESPEIARADRLDEVKARGVLIYGAEIEGGAPYTFPREDDPSRLQGFEVDLVELVARELGVRAQFAEGQWAALGPMVDTGKIDVVFNGYELTPDRARLYRCSRPYYLFGLQLLAAPNGKITDWKDLEDKTKGPFNIGVLGGSAAELHLQHERFKDTVVLTSFDGNMDAMERTAVGQLDATLQDDCAAFWNADRFPTLRFIGRPVGGGFFVAMCKHGEERLGQAIDAAIGKLIESGELEAVYDKWEMGGRMQALALRHADEVHASLRPTFFQIMGRALPVLLKSAGMTVFLSFASMPLAILFGISLAVLRLYGPKPLARLSTLYVEVVRGTPLMLQLYAIFFLLPRLGIEVPALAAAIMGLAINYSAYEAEIYRAGLQAIPRGQMEAAISLGMSPAQAVRRIILPQAVRVVIPPVTNDFIALFKDTSVCSVVTVVELTKQYNILALSTGAILELATITAILYMAMSYPLSLLARWSERQVHPDR